ncbi:hypothetical protein CKO28_18765 [Rhodovibrio sodomensis]|uniref:Alpha/beta hydrolase n=1 Tax=Rhodovibrio sodomensis TaxID=1088 RepID=A0ABS1DHX6_9PROT|nr:hypothetical protein [Rhodovibrio sodomensis]MBK1670081.1 hypothetical protein [Rhodovibrio sodomensis]
MNTLKTLTAAAAFTAAGAAPAAAHDVGHDVIQPTGAIDAGARQLAYESAGPRHADRLVVGIHADLPHVGGAWPNDYGNASGAQHFDMMLDAADGETLSVALHRPGSYIRGGPSSEGRPNVPKEAKSLAAGVERLAHLSGAEEVVVVGFGDSGAALAANTGERIDADRIVEVDGEGYGSVGDFKVMAEVPGGDPRMKVNYSQVAVDRQAVRLHWEDVRDSI